MRKCPKCGKYMENYLKQIFGGTIIVYICQCGYSSEESSTGIVYSERTTKTTSGDSYSKYTDSVSGTEAFDKSREEIVKELCGQEIEGRKHNALYDTEVIKEIYNEVK